MLLRLTIDYDLGETPFRRISGSQFRRIFDVETFFRNPDKPEYFDQRIRVDLRSGSLDYRQKNVSFSETYLN